MHTMGLHDDGGARLMSGRWQLPMRFGRDCTGDEEGRMNGVWLFANSEAARRGALVVACITMPAVSSAKRSRPGRRVLVRWPRGDGFVLLEGFRAVVLEGNAEPDGVR